jgi:hypothetical protein
MNNNFWETMLGIADGKPENAFTKDFGLIPDGTKAFAKIEDFNITEKPANDYGMAKKYYEIKWIITQGEFIGRNIFQKIKAFDAENKIRFKALNMLRLIMNISNVQATNEAPDIYALRKMIGNVMGIKIKEWSIPKETGGIMEGNFVSEVHIANGFTTMIGKKIESVNSFVKTEEDIAF